MQFKILSSYLEKLEKTSSRLQITEILSDLFKQTDINEIEQVVNLLLGQLAPSYKNIVFNIAERMMQQAIAKAFSLDVEKVRSLYKKRGDLGDVAQSLARNNKSSLKVSESYDRLLKIANDEGERSQERKVADMAKLLGDLDKLSVRFVTRIPVGKLRLGFSDKTILDALSWMVKGDKSGKSLLEKAYNTLPDVGRLARSVKEMGIEKTIEHIQPEVGTPILPMLAQRLKSPSEMVKKMKEVSVEPKFDGLRIQIHVKKGDTGFVKAFTRNLNETSWMFPELKQLGKQIGADEVILDTEGIGVDEKRKTLANFQTTMTRRRKHDIDEIASKVKIRFYVFDIMFKNGKSLVNHEYKDRRKILLETVKKGKVLKVVDYKITKDPEVINKMMRMELSEGLEGIIVKRVNSKYVAGRTGWRWVKMKEEEGAKAKLADTLDCIVMGYYAGRGKRSGFGLGGFLVGVRSDTQNRTKDKGQRFEEGKIYTLTKIGTGLTDDQFKELKKRLVKLETSKKPNEYGRVEKNLLPDVWVTPSLVVEIAADEITKSPTHSSGYALRFPRLVKFRDDKSVAQATSVREVNSVYNL